MTAWSAEALANRQKLFAAAENLARVADQLRVLQLCEQATGQAWATPQDHAAVVEASRAWSRAKGSVVYGGRRRPRPVPRVRVLDWPVY